MDAARFAARVRNRQTTGGTLNAPAHIPPHIPPHIRALGDASGRLLQNDRNDSSLIISQNVA